MGVILKVQSSPYLCHIMVCVNDRQNERISCGPANSGEIKQQLKMQVKKRWPGERIRISQTGCLGVCEEGPNVMIYPQQIWFSHVTPDDVEGILDRIDKIVRAGKDLLITK